MFARRSFLAGLTGILTSSALRPLWAQPVPASVLNIRYGWDANVAGPTQATFYVATDGDDTADGSAERPVRTIQRGVDLLAAKGSGSLAIRGGLYREEVSLDALRGTSQHSYHIHRYGQERVTITAADPLTGWMPCPAEEAKALGLTAPDIFVARLPVSRMRHGAPKALNLHEAGQWRSIAVDRADMSNLEAIGDRDTYHAATFEVDADDRIYAIRDPRLIGMPSTSMHDVEALVYHRPNLVSTAQISAFDPQKGEITLTKPSGKMQRQGKKPVMLYALRGAPWALRKGSWIARKTDPEEVSIYFRPVDPASLEKDIEVSLRPLCIDFGNAGHVTLFGIEALRAAGDNRSSGICVRRNGLNRDPNAGSGLQLVHCRMGETMSIGPRGYGALFLRGTSDLKLQNISIEDVRGGFGLFLADGEHVDARFLHIVNASNSPARFYTLRRAVFAFSLLENSARDAHSNKFNFYEGSDAVLVYGVRCRNVEGYATYQKASRIYFAFCDLPSDPGSYSRALVSQNHSTGPGKGGANGNGAPVADSTFYYWNNTLIHEGGSPKRSNALNVGQKSGGETHAFFNNILNGGGFGRIYTSDANPALEHRSHNRYTGLSFWQTPRYGWRLGLAEEMMRAGHRPSGNGRDMRDIIQSEIAPLFPRFTHWDLDIDGRKVDWAAAPIGARVWE
ncbi:hypothetical protein EOK75_20355 (plasmid) [Pseudorhodobacter turbinis]|uniref:Right handed beta helix domain-containing protein n=1 Tax=Pseudorhodobacter turbinis TaxID=2500533 RepID=A0A4V1E1H1_9RHOB|nr:hypothetical protein [Pseudorhodobacter turbinis]QCO58114.1 hypothetical protein EOK75_20355 [Pseudorhodobacter turbinis]